MRVLIACEESQTVCKAFRERGHEAYSCDILPCSGGHPEWHVQWDVLDHVHRIIGQTYDRIISFPPCTDLALSGSRWFDKKRLSGEQEKSIQFFIDVWSISDVVENPKNIMSGFEYIKRWFPNLYKTLIQIGFLYSYRQTIHPWMFGHREKKETWLWYKRTPNDTITPGKFKQGYKPLPILLPTNIVGPPPKPVNEDHRLVIDREWAKVHRQSNSPDRPKLRSKTYPGIAKAMAEQWSENLLK